MTNQWLASPIHTDMAKESVFNFMPFPGTWRKMADSHIEPDSIRQLLQFSFPQSHTVAITSPTVGTDEQFVRFGYRC